MGWEFFLGGRSFSEAIGPKRGVNSRMSSTVEWSHHMNRVEVCLRDRRLDGNRLTTKKISLKITHWR